MRIYRCATQLVKDYYRCCWLGKSEKQTRAAADESQQGKIGRLDVTLLL
jgi:hypothetical protein